MATVNRPNPGMHHPLSPPDDALLPALPSSFDGATSAASSSPFLPLACPPPGPRCHSCEPAIPVTPATPAPSVPAATPHTPTGPPGSPLFTNKSLTKTLRATGSLRTTSSSNALGVPLGARALGPSDQGHTPSIMRRSVIGRDASITGASSDPAAAADAPQAPAMLNPDASSVQRMLETLHAPGAPFRDVGAWVEASRPRPQRHAQQQQQPQSQQQQQQRCQGKAPCGACGDESSACGCGDAAGSGAGGRAAVAAAAAAAAARAARGAAGGMHARMMALPHIICRAANGELFFVELE